MLLRLLNTGGTAILSSNGVSTVMLSIMVARKVLEVDVRNAEVMDTKERRQETWKGKVMGRNYLYTSQGVIYGASTDNLRCLVMQVVREA